MLIIGLIVAALLYALLYWFYLMAETQFTGATSVLYVLNQMLFVQEPSIFFILRNLILITLFYVIAEAILSPARRGYKNYRKRKADAEYDKTVFRGVKPKDPPADDDEVNNSPLALH